MLALQCAEGVLRVGMAPMRDQQRMKRITESEVSLRTLSGEGLTWMARECGPIIVQSLRREAIRAGGHAVILLEPERVYTYLLDLPPTTPKHDLDIVVRGEVAKMIPEETAELTITWEILEETALSMKVGVAAVRTETLQSYIDTASTAGLRTVRVTTMPAAVFSFADARKALGTSFLVSIRPGPDRRGTISVFFHGWPIDEAIIFPGTTDEQLIALLQEMLHDYEKRDLPVQHLVFLGEAPLEEKIRQMTQAVEPGHLPIDIEKGLQKWDGEEWEWAGMRAACTASDSDLHLNFLGKRGPSMRPMIITIVAIVVGLIIVGLLLYLLLP